MRFFARKVLKIFVIITFVVGTLIIVSHWYHVCILPVLPLLSPGFLIFGHEWEPRLGTWGALLAGWVVSLPLSYVLAWMLSCVIASQRTKPPRL